MLRRKVLTSILWIFWLLVPLLGAAHERGYDEVFDGDGFVRPHYRQIYKAYKQLSKSQIRRIEKSTKKDFMGDNEMLALPRVISETEYAELKAGVDQRGRAFLAFLRDHYSGKLSYLDKVIPADVMQRILERNYEYDWVGTANPEQLGFWYGPDIVRGRDGRWRVMEDNPCFVGGVGDLTLSKETALKYVPGYAKAQIVSRPERFYENLVKRYRGLAGGKEVVFLQYKRSVQPDHESRRIRAIFESLGVPNASMRILKGEDTGQYGPQLVVEKDGVYLLKSGAKGAEKVPVGFVITEVEPHQMDPRNPAAYRKRLLDEAQEMIAWRSVVPERVREALKKESKPNPVTGQIDFIALEKRIRGIKYNSLDRWYGVPGLFQAAAEGKVRLSSNPGLEFLGDKEFYMYVEDLIRFYLGEEPILRNVASRTFGKTVNGKRVLDEELFKTVRENFQKYVIKPADGRGGEGIFVGPKDDPTKLAAILEKARANFDGTILQEYMPLSELEGYIVDQRLLADVNMAAGVLVADSPWGRASKGSKVNISVDGKVTAVFVVRPRAEDLQPGCAERLYRKRK
ncbi:MAG: circularly permuted type 2 ATP-grasp protein [Deltaproteobacteria bacterium]|nr:circularly permuted type 2 ATP-grasp protein [Deltaproteobacteria bacterium]